MSIRTEIEKKLENKVLGIDLWILIVLVSLFSIILPKKTDSDIQIGGIYIPSLYVWILLVFTSLFAIVFIGWILRKCRVLYQYRYLIFKPKCPIIHKRTNVILSNILNCFIILSSLVLIISDGIIFLYVVITGIFALVLSIRLFNETDIK